MSASPSERRAKALEQIAKNARRAHSLDAPKIAELTRKQERAVSDLQYAAQHMQRWSGRSAKEIEDNRREFSQDLADYEKTVGRAIRAGLLDHPDVRAWISTQRSLGEWDALRQFRLSLECGTKKTISKQDFWIKFEAYPLSEQGKKPEQIRRLLLHKLRFSTPKDRKKWKEWIGLNRKELEELAERLDCTRQNFHRLLKRLGIK
jgi:hypothetical protein